MHSNSTSEILAGVAITTLLFVVGAVYGRLHGTRSADSISAVGDRVMSGLISLPLVVLLVHLAFPTVALAWCFAAPLPIAIYVMLLAGTDLGWTWCHEKLFTKSLLFGVGAIYLVGAIMIVFQSG